MPSWRGCWATYRLQVPLRCAAPAETAVVEHVAPTGSQDLVEQARQQSEELQQQIEEFRGHKTSLQLQVEEVKAQAALLKQQIDQSYPRTKRQFESKAKDIEALSGQEKELCNSISEKIEQAQHRFSQVLRNAHD